MAVLYERSVLFYSLCTRKPSRSCLKFGDNFLENRDGRSGITDKRTRDGDEGSCFSQRFWCVMGALSQTGSSRYAVDEYWNAVVGRTRWPLPPSSRMHGGYDICLWWSWRRRVMASARKTNACATPSGVFCHMGREWKWSTPMMFFTFYKPWSLFSISYEYMIKILAVIYFLN